MGDMAEVSVLAVEEEGSRCKRLENQVWRGVIVNLFFFFFEQVDSRNRRLRAQKHTRLPTPIARKRA